jgi:hypothetical protein
MEAEQTSRFGMFLPGISKNCGKVAILRLNAEIHVSGIVSL